MGEASDILPAAEIEAMELRDARFGDGEHDVSDLASDRGKLLRHLRALTAPADGEALGRLLGEAIDATMGASAIGAEDIMQKAAIRLHAIGHAAGALSREGEIATATAEGIDIGRAAAWKEANVEIDRLVAQRDGRDAEIARLATELADARGETTRWAAKEGIARADRDIAQTEAARLKRREQDIIEACERVADGGQYRADIIGAINRIRSERDAARADGAREEREAIVKQVRHWAANGRDGMPVVDGNTSLVDWIATEIAESADEIARGDR